MQPTLCSKCKKNVAVVFISRQNEKGEMVNEGLCLKCAKELGLPQVEEMMKRMGISPEDLENINNEMMQAFGGAEELSDMPAPQDEDDEDDGESGKTATFPFLNRLFSGEAAKGGESGGHVGELTTMVLVPQICDATTLPVIAAGGIADGHGLAAALALGASGVAMGTRFVCVDECPISDNHRQWVINHTEKDTVLCQKTIGSMMRVSKNNASLLANEIENRGLRTGKGPMDILKEQMPVITGQKTRVAFQDGNVDSAIFCAGMGMGLVHDVVPVKVLLDRMVKEAEETINSIKASF